MNARHENALLARARLLLGPLEPVPAGVRAEPASLNGVRAVLFDIYGTLLVSVSGDIGAAGPVDREKAFRDSAQASGMAVYGDEPLEVERRLAADIRAHHARAEATGIDVPEVDIRAVWRELLLAWRAEGRVGAWTDDQVEPFALEFECRTNPVWRMPGFPEVVRDLRARFALGIVSNAQFYTPIIMEALTGCALPDLGFDPSLCAWSWEQGCAKPSPHLLGVLLERLSARGVAPRELAVVGNDAARDIAPARALGCRSILFAGDRRSFRPKAGVQPDAVITELAQLTDVLSPA